MGVYVTDQTKKGWLTSILELGAWFGTLYSGFLAEIISRKYAILVNTAIFILGVVIQCTAVTSAGASAILGGRFVVGMGVGSLSMISMGNLPIRPIPANIFFSPYVRS
jgi:MFS family permease